MFFPTWANLIRRYIYKTETDDLVARVHTDVPDPTPVAPIVPNEERELYVATFDPELLMSGTAKGVDLSRFGSPGDYRILPYLLRGVFGKREREEVVARIVLGLSGVNEWRVFTYHAFMQAFLDELRAWNEDPNRYLVTPSNSVVMMLGQSYATCEQINNDLITALNDLIDEGFLGRSDVGAQTLLWPLPPMLERLERFRVPSGH